ncbi:MAG: PadR family transcriptional regulator [Acidimicrobiia bacterium]|nr:PadR family transcriptional regulator [Acidimicrobiia bacterium]
MAVRSGPEASLTPTSYLVLGLVGHHGTATSYALKKTVAGTIGGFWSVPHSQLYAEPTRLVGLGLLADDQESGGRRRRTYSLTPAGRRELDQWLAMPTEEGTELRDLALLKLYFGGQSGPGSVRRVAAHAVEVHRRRLAAYEALVMQPPPRADLYQLAILALAARYESEAVAFWDAVAVDPDLG